MASKIDVLCLPGTFEPDGELISDTFMAHLDSVLLNPVYVGYPASYGDPEPYADSRQAGYDNLLAAAGERFPDPVYVYGYSQGAWGAGAVARDAAAGVLTEVNLAGCALMADPLRPRSRVPVAATLNGFSVMQPSGGYGISGERDIDGVPVWWAAVHDDPITSLPAGNPMRLVADLSVYYSISSPAAVTRWFEQMVLAAIDRSLQPWWHRDHWRDWPGAFDAILNYGGRGRHTDAYVNEGHAAALASAVNAHASGAAAGWPSPPGMATLAERLEYGDGTPPG